MVQGKIHGMILGLTWTRTGSYLAAPGGVIVIRAEVQLIADFGIKRDDCADDSNYGGVGGEGDIGDSNGYAGGDEDGNIDVGDD